MPDLFTHTLINAALPVGALRPVRLACFVAGGVLPDLASRLPAISLARGVFPFLPPGVDLDWLVLGLGFMHVPLGVVALALLVGAGLPGFLLAGLGRWDIVRLLSLGAAVHLALDLMQRHTRPAYQYLIPFSMRPCELGWFDADASLTWWPWLVPLTAASLVVSWLRWRRQDDEARPGA